MKTFIGLYAAYLAFIIAGFVGWVMNLISVVSLFINDAPVTGMFIGRIVGVLAFPLGAILGYF